LKDALPTNEDVRFREDVRIITLRREYITGEKSIFSPSLP
jgi:hypothetical protein